MRAGARRQWLHFGHYITLLVASFALHWCVAALHPTLALVLATGWAVAAATAARAHMRARQAAWVTLLAALQLCNAAAGSLALLAWHRLPWSHWQWAHGAEVDAAAQAAFAAMMLCVTQITAASFWPEDSSLWLITALRSALRPVLQSSAVAVTALVVAVGSLAVQLGLPASTKFLGLDLAPNISMGKVLVVLFMWNATKARDDPVHVHAD